MTMRAYGIDYFLNLLQCEGRCGIADGKYVRIEKEFKEKEAVRKG